MRANVGKHGDLGRGLFGRLGYAMFLALRLALVLVSVQLTGIAHVAADIVLGEHVTHDEGGQGDGDDDPDCPPGCPTCHHANGGVAAPPAPIEAILAAFPEVAEVVALTYESETPPSPPLPGLYRPPRA